MPRSSMATLVVAAAVTLSCSAPTSNDSLDYREPSRIGRPCPEIADSCPAGCFHVGGFPVDEKNACMLPPKKWGCSPVRDGPPAVICSVAPDGTRWISIDGRIYPQGRYCMTDDEFAALHYPGCR